MLPALSALYLLSITPPGGSGFIYQHRKNYNVIFFIEIIIKIEFNRSLESSQKAKAAQIYHNVQESFINLSISASIIF